MVVTSGLAGVIKEGPERGVLCDRRDKALQPPYVPLG